MGWWVNVTNRWKLLSVSPVPVKSAVVPLPSDLKKRWRYELQNVYKMSLTWHYQRYDHKLFMAVYGHSTWPKQFMTARRQYVKKSVTNGHCHVVENSACTSANVASVYLVTMTYCQNSSLIGQWNQFRSYMSFSDMTSVTRLLCHETE